MRRPPASLSCWLPPLAAAVVLFAALPCAGQDASSDSGYSVRGTVVNAISGQAVGRALVALDRDEAVLTDSNGAFSFDNVAAGSYSVSVEKPGYQGFGGMFAGVMLRASSGVFRMVRTPPRQIQVGPNMPALTFRIQPLGVITGHITLSTSDPADGIRVQAYTRELQNGRARWIVAGMGRTRSDGSFRIANLEPGSYVLATMPSLDRPGGPANDRAPVWGYPSMYYPGVTDVTAAGMITLAAGQQAEADLSLARQQFFAITALVHSPEDTPANFQILDSSGRPAGISAQWNRREGAVHATVPNGNWTLQAHSYGKTMQWGSTSFQVNGAPVSLAISIVPVPHIPVTIRRDFTNSTDTPQQASSGPGMNLQLIAADETSLAFMSGGMTEVNGSGGQQFEATVTQPGRYWVEVQAYPPAYVGSITSGGVDLGSAPITILPGSTPPPIEVTLRNDPGTITGEIVSGSVPTTSNGPVPTAGERPQVWIYAIPLFSTAARLPEGSMEPNGQFSIPNLSPGSYRVVACDTPQEIDFHSAEGLAAWSGKGETVTVDAGGTASAELEVLHSGEAP